MKIFYTFVSNNKLLIRKGGEGNDIGKSLWSGS